MRRLPLFLSIGFGALLIGLWGFNEPERSPALLPALPVQEVDAYLSGAHILQYSADGTPFQRLQAKHIAHYPDGDLTRLEKPRLEVFRSDQVPVSITAQQGTLGPEGKQLILEQAVEIRSLSPDNPYQLETEQLILEPERDYAETEEPVVIRSPGGVTHATGMQAYIKEGRVLLLSKVRGTYDPK